MDMLILYLLFQPYIDQALGDLEMASKLSPGRYDGLERMAEVIIDRERIKRVFKCSNMLIYRKPGTCASNIHKYK